MTGAEQDALAAANPTNALLRFRGNAGSHDVGLGVETLRALRDVNGVRGDGGEARGAVRVPRYATASVSMHATEPRSAQPVPWSVLLPP